MKKYIVYIVVIVVIFSCKRESMKPAEYLSWIKTSEAQLSYRKTVNDIVFEALYKPSEYLALKEYSSERTDTNFQDKKFREYLAEKKKSIFFTYRIRPEENGIDILHYRAASENVFFQRADYYSFKAQNDFYLLQGKDTFPCTIYHFEQNYGLAPYINLLIGFESHGKTDDMKLVFYDQVYQKGKIIFDIPKEALLNIPELKL
ncbi:MAG: hypothetical protein A2275_14875 [Bacteroidetes bacterium RIFOXYA12_FULL_35_11]|nr:MAG: hypothetical protein A2275_14875 [Bacteroidetes bacterium RIFOXYA12_FULL_35_11]OFY93347.1 MAG: hypothetical protein A2309_05965 [Bacteroidetes bacterium RIFOXYB2_FULL_35_7]OFY95875.1 MAG: hypothetical protein A2491_19540 [Bacteroidetes bacterium RIFOXYC12_FULL_35_7]HBX50423.1 hypothetical protein [Bacteroidales bacterium]